MFVSIIIPACDIEPDTTPLQKVMATTELMYEIIIEYDSYREGKGITLQRGFKRSSGDIIVWYDADNEIKPSSIPEMIHLLNGDTTGQPDIGAVIGSKMHKDSRIHYPFGRRIVSKVGHWVIKTLFGLPIKDSQTGIKVFRRELLEGQWISTGFGFDVEILCSIHEKGLGIIEVPVVIRKHNSKEVFLMTLFKTLTEILKLKRRLK